MSTASGPLIVSTTLAISLMASTAVRADTAELSAPWMAWPENQVQPLMDAFEAETGIRVSAERLPIAELFRTLEIRLTARTSDPDVFLVDGPLTASYAIRGHLLDLTPHFADRFDEFLPAAIEQGTFDGRLYAAPMATSSQILYYNRALFEAAGLEPPSSNPEDRMTWEETLEIARQLTDRSAGQFGLAFENINPYQLLPLPQSRGVEVIGEDGLTATGYVDSDGFVEVMEWFQQLHGDDGVAPAGGFITGTTQQMFGNGQIAMLVGGTWNIVGFQQFADLDFGAAPHPYFEGGTPVTPTGSWHIGINPRTDNMDEALAFVEWLMRHDTNELWFELRGNPPALASMWSEHADTTFAAPAWQIVQYELANTAVPRPATPAFREYEQFLRTAMQDIQTGADVRRALEQAAQNIDRETRRFR